MYFVLILELGPFFSTTNFISYDHTIHNAIGHNIPNPPWRRYAHSLYLDPYLYPTVSSSDYVLRSTTNTNTSTV